MGRGKIVAELRAPPANARSSEMDDAVPCVTFACICTAAASSLRSMTPSWFRSNGSSWARTCAGRVERTMPVVGENRPLPRPGGERSSGGGGADKPGVGWRGVPTWGMGQGGPINQTEPLGLDWVRPRGALRVGDAESVWCMDTVHTTCVCKCECAFFGRGVSVLPVFQSVWRPEEDTNN